MTQDWPFAQELAALPLRWKRLLELHVAAADGACAGCRTQTGPTIRWPCILHSAAARAAALGSAQPKDGDLDRSRV